METSNNSNMSITWLSGQLHVRVLWPILPHLRQLIGSGSSTKGRALPRLVLPEIWSILMSYLDLFLEPRLFQRVLGSAMYTGPVYGGH